MHPDQQPKRGGGVSVGSHASWFRNRLVGARILDVGAEEQATRSWRSLSGRNRRRVMIAAAVVLAFASAAAGIALSLSRSDVQVSMDTSGYRIGSATLRAVAPGVYSGEGELVISRSGSGNRAASSAQVHGTSWLGVCDVSGDGMHQSCRLQGGGRVVTAQDAWSDGVWQRRYSDGVTATIAAARGVPVPFPVGR